VSANHTQRNKQSPPKLAYYVRHMFIYLAFVPCTIIADLAYHKLDLQVAGNHRASPHGQQGKQNVYFKFHFAQGDGLQQHCKEGLVRLDKPWCVEKSLSLPIGGGYGQERCNVDMSMRPLGNQRLPSGDGCLQTTRRLPSGRLTAAFRQADGCL
jgi:hypothetical protein